MKTAAAPTFKEIATDLIHELTTQKIKKEVFVDQLMTQIAFVNSNLSELYLSTGARQWFPAYLMEKNPTVIYPKYATRIKQDLNKWETQTAQEIYDTILKCMENFAAEVVILNT